MHRLFATSRHLPLALGSLILALGVSVSGCKATDTEPTNTKNSVYMDKGDTAADKIGARRIRAHMHDTTPPPTTPP